MDWDFDVAHPLSLRPDKQIYAQAETGRAVSVRWFSGERALCEARARRDALRADLGDCPWVNLPAELRVERREGRWALIEEMRLGAPDGPRDAWEADLLRGLGALHRAGWAHMDLKPEHLLWVEGRWRLHDLDGAKRLGERFRRRDITYAYAPPDALVRDRADGSDDLYAAALMLYRFRNASRLPFERNSERAATLLRWALPWLPVPRAWDTRARSFFRRALSRRRKRRYSTADELIEAWRELELK